MKPFPISFIYKLSARSNFHIQQAFSLSLNIGHTISSPPHCNISISLMSSLRNLLKTFNLKMNDYQASNPASSQASNDGSGMWSQVGSPTIPSVGGTPHSEADGRGDEKRTDSNTLKMNRMTAANALSGHHRYMSQSALAPVWHGPTGDGQQPCHAVHNQARGPFHPSHNVKYADTLHTGAHPLGVIGDRRPSACLEPSSGPINTNQPEAPVRGDASIRGFGFQPCFCSSCDAGLGSSYASTLDTVAASTYFQPMTHLKAGGKSYIPGPLDGLNPAHPYAHGKDQLVQSMQQLGSSNPDIGPVARIKRHFSPHYQGDIFLPANQSENISNDRNCSLFIVNLPPNLTTHELLAAIHKMGPSGRIFAIHINEPEPQLNHPGCAAKVVFFKRDVAHKFFNLCELGGFQVDGYNARVMWNRIKTSEKPHLAHSDASRVLLIGGPPNEVNSDALTKFFSQKLEFQTDLIITHNRGSLGKQDAVIEFRFGSFRCQAQAAKMALAREKPFIRCFFGRDPLELEAYKPFEYFFTNNKV